MFELYSLEDLPRVARKINAELRNAGFPTNQRDVRQVVALNEEVGEFTGAWRRFVGMARRSGTFDEMVAELADVIITAFVTADALGLNTCDIEEAISSKLKIIFARGWRENVESTEQG